MSARIDWPLMESMTFDFAMDRGAAGFTIEELAAHLGTPRVQVARGAIHRVRQLIRSDGNIVCEPGKWRDSYLYRIEGDIAGAKTWIDSRRRDMESRLRTLWGVSQSLVLASTDGSADGRRARIVERDIRHLLENLEDVEV